MCRWYMYVLQPATLLIVTLLQMFFKKGVLENFANFTGKHVLESLFDKVLKRDPTQAFSCEILFVPVLHQYFFAAAGF